MRWRRLINTELYDTSLCVIYDRLSLWIGRGETFFHVVRRQAERGLWLEYLIELTKVLWSFHSHVALILFA